jgi:hypothetical protein
MIKTVITILTISIFTLTAFSQDLTLKCGDKEIECKNGNKDHFDIVIHCPYQETDTTKLPQIVLENARKYLTKRVGLQFYQQLNYYACQIIDFSKFDEIKKQKGWIDEKADKRVKYAVQYFFVVQDSMRYYLTLAFDTSGNIISKDQLPNISSNMQFDKIISVCDAKQFAEQDKKFKGELQNISLEFSDKANAFIWRIEMPTIKGKKKRENVHRFLLLNANNGQLVKRETEIWTTVCGLPALF